MSVLIWIIISKSTSYINSSALGLGAIQGPGQNDNTEIPIKLVDSAKQIWDVVRDAANKLNKQCDRY